MSAFLMSLTRPVPAIWSAAMPRDNSDSKKPEMRPEKAPEKPVDPSTKAATGKIGSDREQRLAEALRANLRRRKSGSSPSDKKED